ncbi:MAG: pyridoxine 5'-phosphate synthase [Phycisphaerae bacterium]|nr:pyridoxine 5'-phosphate synthase [Phycisphaerae bacterium]
MANLGVNIDHVATVRQARRTDEPDPVWAAVEAQLGGADCITFHLREDRRHIVDRDARVLKDVVNVKLNMEMAIHPAIVKVAIGLRPEQCTLVPERREEVTTEGGLDIVRLRRRVQTAVARLRQAGSIVSAFIEPESDQIRASADVGCQAVELWTGGYAHAQGERAVRRELAKLEASIVLGQQCGLVVHGGHGLTYRNIEPVARIPGFDEFNIGHSIIARAVFVGLRAAVAEMKALLVRFAPAARKETES